MDVTLDPTVPLFQHLAELASQAGTRGIPLRLVGGTSMLLWGKSFDRQRDMTFDLDCALLETDLPDEAAATALVSELLPLLAELGYARSSNWRESRKARYCYEHETARVAVEFLCGDLSVGKPSRRRPARRIAASQDGPPDFYAAHVPSLDLVPTWVPVRAHCGKTTFSLHIPDLPGLTALKIRAVRDKIERVEKSLSDQQEYEKRRLQRHGMDCAVLFEWMDEQGEFPALVKLAREHTGLRRASTEAARWLMIHDTLARELELGATIRGLERLAP